MRFEREHGGLSTVCIMLIFLFVNAVCAASIPVRSCNAAVGSFNRTRRADNSPGEGPSGSFGADIEIPDFNKPPRCS